MKKTGRDNRPHLPPVQRVELSGEHTVLRIILMAGFLAIALVAFGTGLHSLLSTEPTWQVVEENTKGPTWAEDFVLRYDFGSAGKNATTIKRQLTRAYSDALEMGYRLFAPEVREEGFYNIGYLNDHPNEDVAVEAGLYQALELAARSGDRHIFLAPAAAEYMPVFSCGDDVEATLLDPGKNGESADWLRELSEYTADPQHIRLELKGEGKVRLAVSQEYLRFAREYEITTLLDFGFLLNTFQTDYLADRLASEGFLYGYLASSDGYTRNLDPREGSYEQNLIHREGTGISQPARLRYTGPMSIVTFRNYPMTDRDQWRCYAYQNGDTVSLFLDSADCRSKSALPELTVYARELSCGELAVLAANCFVSDDFRQEELSDLREQGGNALWFEGSKLCYTDPENPPYLLGENTGYSLSLK